MDSDDDFQLFTLPEETSPPLAAAPKMKRLKKLSRVLKESGIDDVAAASGDESVTRSGDGGRTDVEFGGDLTGDLVMDECESEKEVGDMEGVVEEDVERFGSRELSAKRALDFDGDGGQGGVREGDLEVDGDEKRWDVEEGSEKVKGKNKKKKRSELGGEDLESSKAMSKRRSEKERREYLNQLHAESQRLLRETRDAGFKHAPIVHKPISSVLEKIRKRKLELQKKTVNRNSICSVVDDDDDDLQFCEGFLIPNSESIPLGGKTDAGLSEQVKEAENRDVLEVEHGFKEASIDIREATDEEPASSLRAPICDTQDLFCDSEASDSKNGISSKINEDVDPSEENFEPSVLAMNLQFDSALPDDDDDDNYSDGEDYNKENVAPLPPMPRGDPVQAFVDDEAVEEDDSDNDQLRFQEDEDDLGEDAEELDEMIATDFEENRVDQERRQELHMKMLEQQDAAGIDNLLQRYKCESKLSEPRELKDEDYMEEDESCDEALETEAPKNSLRLCVKKAKQMIVHMFTDNEDVYVSSEDEELETRVVNRVFRKSDEKKKIITPDQDEGSREVFGLIKKLNIAAEMKKKAKFSSFDMMTSKSLGSSKPSFLNRTSSSSLPSSRKHGSNVTRAFVFARDDSNSRSSIAVTEDSDTVQNEARPTMRSTAKFSQSQSKQKSKDAAETVAGSSSLFEMLRRSAVQQHSQDGIVGKTDSVFASFKLPKRSKIEGKL